MSFPRAKIQRFNDATNGTPAPGSYDPKFEKKVKGAVMEKSGRFIESKAASEVDSPANQAVKSSSMTCLPVFRTPQLPRKMMKSISKTKSKESATKKDASTSAEEIFPGKRLFSSAEVLDDTDTELTKCKEQCAALEYTISLKKPLIADLEKNNESLEALVKQLEDESSKTQLERMEILSEFEKSSVVCLEQLKEVHELLADKNLGFQEDLRYAKEELITISSINTDLEQKIAQKQQMILLLQGELSSSAVECERMQGEHSEEVKCLHDTIWGLEQHQEDATKQLHALRDNLMNGSVVRENLETSLAEKEVALWATETSYERLLAECERLKAVHQIDLEDTKNIHNTQVRELLQKVETAAKFFENNSLCLKMNCNDKLLEFEGRFKCVLTKAVQDKEDQILGLQKQLQLEAEKLQSMENSTQGELTTLRGANKLVSMKMKDLESELRIITEKLLHAEEELRRVCACRDDLRVSNIDNQVAIVELQDKVDTLGVEKSSLAESLSTATTEQDVLKAKNIVLTVGNRNLNHSLEALKARLLESESDVEKIEAEKANLVTDVKTANNELENQRLSIAKLEAENLQQIEEVRKDLLQKLESLKNKSILDNETMQKVEAEKQLQIEGLSIQLEMFRQEFHQLGIYVTAIEMQNEDQGRKLAALEDMKKQLEETSLCLAMREESCNSLSAELQQCRGELSTAQGKIAAQEEQILECKCIMEQLSAEAADAETKIVELKEMNNNLEETNSEQETAIEALTEKLDHQWECATVANQQIADLSSELECHKDFSHQATEHMLTLANANSEKEKQIENLVDEIESLKRSNTDLADEMKELAMELMIVQEKVQETSDEVKLLEGDRFVKEEQLQQCRGELSAAQGRIAAQEEHILEYKRIVEELSTQVAETKMKALQLREMSNNLEDLKSENKRQKECCQQYLAEIAQLETSKLKNQETILQTNSQIKTLSDHVAEKEHTIQKLQTKCKKLQATVEADEAAISDLQKIFEAKQQAVIQCKTLTEELEKLKIDNLDSQKGIRELQTTLSEEEEKAARAAEWEQRYNDLNTLIGPFKDQLEAYRSEYQHLQLEKGEVEGEVRELAKQYGDILGHQNHKQKIKHMTKITAQNVELKEEVRKMKRTVDRLRKEHSAVTCKTHAGSHTPFINKGKENMGPCSPVPKSPAGSPLLERAAQKNVI